MVKGFVTRLIVNLGLPQWLLLAQFFGSWQQEM